LLILFVSSFFLSHCGSGERKGEGRNGPDLLAFYYPWYGNPSVSGRWIHWNASGHNPDKKIDGLPDIASPFHPFLGPYDSADTAVIEQHLRWAEYAGIDAFIVSWWGRGDLTDRNLEKLFNIDERSGGKIRLTLYYEGNFTSPATIEDDLDYICGKYVGRNLFYRYGGRPVMFLYGRAIFPAFWDLASFSRWRHRFYIDWLDLIVMAKEKCNLLLVADVMTPRFSSAMEQVVRMGFEAVHVYNPALEFYSNFDPPSHYAEMADFAHSYNLLFGLTVIPGYDDGKLGRTFTFELPRNNGLFFSMLIEEARKFNPDWIIITSFNEWHEGTQIEPAIEYGNKYLKLVRGYLGR